MLTELMSQIAQRRVRMVEVETPTPSPFAASLLFGYVGAFMYEGDSPLAERRAAALSLDTTLLAELLGRIELRELLDAEVVAATSRQLQHLADDRRARDAEGVADLLRRLGPLTADEIAERCTASDVAAWLEGLAAAKRVLEVSYAGQRWWVAIEDIGRLRDAVGVAVPVGVPASFTEESADPLGELLSRYARTRGPFTTAEAADRFGLGRRVAADVLVRMSLDTKLVRGEFTDSDESDQWCDTEVLRILRRRSLAALRAQVEPVSTRAYARFLPVWQQVGTAAGSGVDGLATVIDQLAGVPLPASAVESLVFAPRVRGYQPAMLDELLASGEVTWSGSGAISAHDGWVVFHNADSAALTLGAPAEFDHNDAHRAILDILGRPGDSRGAYFFRQLADGAPNEDLVKSALWELIWGGWVTGDTFAPVRAILTGARKPGSRRSGTPAHRHRRAPRLSRYSLTQPPTRTLDPTVAGRWSAVPAREPDSTVRAHFTAELLMNRYGVLTKSAVAAEGVPGGFAMLYKVLTAFEEAGRCQRGYFVESLGGAQFAIASTVDRLRGYADPLDTAPPPYDAVVLAATDPANPYGAALPWPAGESGHRPGRKAGALVVMVDGELVWFLERGGKSLVNFSADPDAQRAAAGALAELVGIGRIGGILVERLDGLSVLEVGQSDAVEALLAAGFARTPRGLRIR
jgi:ATP-dependent Lhr-like helicase